LLSAHAYVNKVELLELNSLMGILKPQSNGSLYSITMTGTLAVTFGRARRWLGGLRIAGRIAVIARQKLTKKLKENR